MNITWAYNPTMAADAARKWLIVASLILTTATFVVLWAAPAFGYRLEFRDAIRITEIALPVFLGYLGAATQFVFQNLARHQNKGIRPEAENVFLGLIVKGPIVAFTIAVAVIFISFGYTNRPAAPRGSGMSVDQFALGISAALGLLNVTTNVAVAYLFSLERRPIPVESAASSPAAKKRNSIAGN
jgi:hypothetical protein